MQWSVTRGEVEECELPHLVWPGKAFSRSASLWVLKRTSNQAPGMPLHMRRHEDDLELMSRGKTRSEVRAGPMWACVWRRMSVQVLPMEIGENGWGRFKRTFCNSLLLFPLVFIKLSYLICNGFHPVAFIPQGSNNIQLLPFSPQDSFLLLTGYNRFITNGLK